MFSCEASLIRHIESSFRYLLAADVVQRHVDASFLSVEFR